MNSVLRWGIATILLAALVHLVAVYCFPTVMMSMAQRAIRNRVGGANRIYHSPPVTVKTNELVMQSPDLLYSSCAYDLADGPVRIFARVPDTYWSLSLYQANTDNFFILNDRQVDGDRVEVVLIGKGQGAPTDPKVRVITAPTKKGVIALRSLIQDASRLDELIAVQGQAFCAPYATP